MIEQLITWMQSAGYWGVAALMALENLFPPIPSELIMPLAGFIAAKGQLTVAGVLAAATVGSVGGTLPWFYTAKMLGCTRLCDFADKHGRWLTLSTHDIDRGLSVFRKHGRKMVIIGRLVPAIRSFISIPAGLAEMPLGRFLLYSTIGSLVWNMGLMGAGYVLEDHYHEVARYIDPIAKIVLAFILLTYIWRLIFFRKTPRS
ncbi:alkaline phosphatase [Massilia eurypsychrophila]|uniref:Alkaline phosphatase n=1 Tax=Massilia eurypsychrophila TaxID=1485217 RepID=A0A2G8T7B9_9BURK|nr:DedA family protein [Massilia eurypsychrophila]PIL41950.1 alkaline phosphatase [Massilia eurypsychrophila]